MIVKNIRNTFDDIILTTDVIVGFPGETEEEFNCTYEFLKKIKFYKTHVFKYSERKGTVASKMPNKILPEEKEKRSNILIELSDNNEKEYLKKYIGKKVKVLFEEEKNGFYQGHTDNFLLVKVKNSEDISNQIIEVIIEDIDKLELCGIVI